MQPKRRFSWPHPGKRESSPSPPPSRSRGGAIARNTIVDFTPGIYLVSGSGWDYHDLDLTDNARCDRNACEIPIGFAIDFGDGPVDRLFISENGIVTFGSPLPEGENGGLNPGQLHQSYIAPFYADLVSVAEAEDDLGEIWQSPGRLDPAEDPDHANDTSPKSWFEGEKAFKVDWHGVTRAGASGRLFIQIAIYDRPGNDFDLEFNYGYIEPTIIPLNGAKVGFRLGTNQFRFNGSTIDNRNDLRFEFRNSAWANR